MNDHGAAPPKKQQHEHRMKPDPCSDRYVCQQEGCEFQFTGEQLDYIKRLMARAGWNPTRLPGALGMVGVRGDQIVGDEAMEIYEELAAVLRARNAMVEMFPSIFRVNEHG